MNAGFPTDDPRGDRQEPTAIAAFDARVRSGSSFTREARSGFEYSNLGYALLGRIVTQASETDYLEFVTCELLGPLGMHATYCDTGASTTDGALVAEPCRRCFSLCGENIASSAKDRLARAVCFVVFVFGAGDNGS